MNESKEWKEQYDRKVDNHTRSTNTEENEKRGSIDKSVSTEKEMNREGYEEMENIIRSLDRLLKDGESVKKAVNALDEHSAFPNNDKHTSFQDLEGESDRTYRRENVLMKNKSMERSIEYEEIERLYTQLSEEKRYNEKIENRYNKRIKELESEREERGREGPHREEEMQILIREINTERSKREVLEQVNILISVQLLYLI